VDENRDEPTASVRAPSGENAEPGFSDRREGRFGGKKMLLHICCGPCSTYPLPWLQEAGYEVTGYFYNPNIHPYTEYARREESARRYAEARKVRMIFDDDYRPTDYFQAVAFREARRCFMCYQLRLFQAARIARRGAFDFFTTTLLVSPYQKHAWVREIGEAAADAYGAPFFYRDFREGFSLTRERAQALGLYRQSYCGCLYSEAERYRPKTSKGRRT
jgi:predicted adenine nucleotide alpha hydrolase (AANH) superfamily ATPase